MKLTKESMKLIGANIRRERILRSMSMEELADILQLSVAFLGLIERGQRGSNLANLMKIADVFEITVNDLIGCKNSTTPSIPEIRDEWEGHEKPTESDFQQKRNAIISHVYDFSIEEMEFLIDSIKVFRAHKKSNKKHEHNGKL